MDVGEILQIANNLIQLDMDVAQNQYVQGVAQQTETSNRQEGYLLQEGTAPWFEAGHHLEVSAYRRQLHSLMYGFIVAHNTISCIVHQVCSAISEEYQE